MALQAPNDRGWVNDLVYHYRLNSNIISKYLARKWGDYDFRIKVSRLALR